MADNFTYFKVTKLPSLHNLVIDALPAVVDFEYSMILYDTMALTPIAPIIKGVDIDTMEFKLKNNTTGSWTENNIVKISNKADENTPESDNVTISINAGITVNIFDELTLNSSVDRLKIVSKSNNLVLKLNGLKTLKNEFSYQELLNLTFTTGSVFGTGVYDFTFQVGNHLGYNLVNNYTFSVDVVGETFKMDAGLETIETYTLGGHSFITPEGEILQEDLSYHTDIYQIINLYDGYSNGTAALSIDITGTLLPNNTYNYVSVNEPEGFYTSENVNTSFNMILDIDGVKSFNLNIGLKDTVPISGTITIVLTLVSLDGNTGIIDPILNTITINKVL